MLTQAEFKEEFLGGLDWIDRFARSTFESRFLNCTLQQQISLLKEIRDEREEIPDELQTGSRFFLLMKQLTVTGYYTSQIGLLEEMGYQGNRYLSSFPAACQHDQAGDPDGHLSPTNPRH